MLTPALLELNRTNRRAITAGLTLLEVLIVVVLLGALAAIVAPTLIDRLDERAFEAAADGTNEQLMMARAHAQATGDPVEVTYSPATGHVQARRYAPWDSGNERDLIQPGTSPLASNARDFNSSAASHDSSRSDRSLPGDAQWLNINDSAGEGDENRDIAEGWALRPLGRGIRIGTHRPFAFGEVPTEELCLPDGTLITVTSESDLEELMQLEQGQDVRLAVFMPDGSAMVGPDLWLDDGSGRCGRITINPWSGLPMFHRLANLTDDALARSLDDSADPAPATAGRDRSVVAWPDARGDE